MVGVEESRRYDYTGPAYLVLDGTEVEQIKVTHTESGTLFNHPKEYRDHTWVFANAVDITDKNCTENPLTIKICKQIKEYFIFTDIELSSKYYDFMAYINDYLIIY